MTPQSFKYDKGDILSTPDSKPFMSRRLGTHMNPTKISEFSYGSPEFQQDLETALLKSARQNVDFNKMKMSVTQNVMQWSLFKRSLQAKSSFKSEMYSKGSNFQRIGIPTRSSQSN